MVSPLIDAKKIIHLIIWLLIAPLVLLLCNTYSFAADVSLTVGHHSINNTVIVSIENNSPQDVLVESVRILLDKKFYEQTLRQSILPRQKIDVQYRIVYPSLPGSYPLTATVTYRNDGKLLSLIHTALYHYIEPAPLNISCSIDAASISGSGDITLRASQLEIWELILPDEIVVTGSMTLPDRKIFHVAAVVPDVQCSYALFAVAEKTAEGKHAAALVSGKLTNKAQQDAGWTRGRISSLALACQVLLFASIAYYFLMLRQPAARLTTAFTKYACRMLFLTGCYFFLKHADAWVDAMLSCTPWDSVRQVMIAVRDNFRGSNYEYFFRYVVDYYWGVCLLLTLPYLFFLDAETPLAKDKYACFLKTIFTVGNWFRGKKPYWNYESRLGMLTIFVKLFYIPYLTSWAINNTFHQKNLAASFHWDIATVNAFLVSLFVYIDTAVYAFGYIVEAGFLKNRIKSVEPTVLGWVVCLWCYPPFNIFSFTIFDYPLISINHEYPPWVQVWITCLISVLWGIFAWASVALGFKASNLTNRGIVATGPYRYVRHPAYTAKVIIWIVQGIFFAQYTVGILLGFILIYYLRAWTEERHLSRDPDYLAYKKKVARMFVPGVL